jgi:polyhydroxyalkanoate synthase
MAECAPAFPPYACYWNADSTRMPAAMHSFYLRNMYQENLLVKPGGITLDGVPIDLRKIRTPIFLLSTREDHIALAFDLCRHPALQGAG